MQSNLAREAGAHGVDPARLIYAPRVASTSEHRARFALADVFLDTTPYNAHTTAGEPWPPPFRSSPGGAAPLLPAWRPACFTPSNSAT
jgi:hypothetical protein